MTQPVIRDNIALLHARGDGSFVIRLGAYPYHVTADDPLFPAVSAAADGVDLPAEPAPPTIAVSRHIMPLAFMDRLAPETQAAIATAALSSAPLMLWLLRLAAAHYVDLDAPETAIGVGALLSAEVITAEEAVALLA